MRTFSKQETVDVVWTATAWGAGRHDHGCAIRRPGRTLTITHEDSIEELIPDAPDDLKAYVRAEILAHRPEGDDEVRDPSTGFLWQLKWDDNSKRARNLSTESTWYRHEYFSGSEMNARAGAWFEKNRPAPEWQEVAGAPGYAIKRGCAGFAVVSGPNNVTLSVKEQWVKDGSSNVFAYPEPVIAAVCRLFGIPRADVLQEDETMNAYGDVYKLKIVDDKVSVHGGLPYGREWLEAHTGATWVPRALAYLNKYGVKLAENQIEGNGPGDVRTLRWHNGVAQQHSNSHGWEAWNFGCSTRQSKAGDAWFRANCPADRFVTDDGTLLEFRMRDDGEARSQRVDNGSWFGLGTEYPINADSSSHHIALHVFRDAERAKWTCEWCDDRTRQCIAITGPGLNGYGHETVLHGTYCGAWGKGHENIHTWVRTRAEQLWRDRNAAKPLTYSWSDVEVKIGGVVIKDVKVKGRTTGSYIPEVSFVHDGKRIKITIEDAKEGDV